MLLLERYLTEAGQGTFVDVILQLVGTYGNIPTHQYKKYVLHHKDGNHKNNKVNNLIIMPQKLHKAYHQSLINRGLTPKDESLPKYVSGKGRKYIQEYSDSIELQEFFRDIQRGILYAFPEGFENEVS